MRKLKFIAAALIVLASTAQADPQYSTTSTQLSAHESVITSSQLPFRDSISVHADQGHGSVTDFEARADVSLIANELDVSLFTSLAAISGTGEGCENVFFPLCPPLLESGVSRATFTTAFSVAVPTSYTISGEVFGLGTGLRGPIASGASFELTGDLSTGDSYQVAFARHQGSRTGGGPLAVYFTGILEPGEYQLFVGAGNDLYTPSDVGIIGLSTYSYADLNVTFAPVPLPGAAWLLLSGLFTLIGVTKRRAGS